MPVATMDEVGSSVDFAMRDELVELVTSQPQGVPFVDDEFDIILADYGLETALRIMCTEVMSALETIGLPMLAMTMDAQAARGEFRRFLFSLELAKLMLRNEREKSHRYVVSKACVRANSLYRLFERELADLV